MIITYLNDELELHCLQQREARKAYGADNAKKLLSRLADLADAANVSELAVGNPHPLRHDRQGQFALSLCGGCRLVFAPADVPPPQREDGSIDWSAVTSVCIVFIGDYHD
jgi:proteic killer suppression protein